MSNRELPMMPWFPDQFAASTVGWSFMQRAIYRALLELQWQAGDCACISASRSRLSRALKIDGRTLANVWPIVGAKFAPVPGGLQNFRLEQHRLRALALRKNRLDKARLAASARWSKHTPSNAPSNNAGNASSNAQAMPSLSIKNKTLPPYPPSRKRAANGGTTAAARPSAAGSGAIREDDPEVRRRRREAEALAAQHAQPGGDDDMPF